MIVEIINVGTELLLGEIVNTNAKDILKMCKDLGFNVYYQTVVGDNPDRLLECFDIAFKRGANCVITTGGLGPTQDDVTKELSARYLGLELYYNEKEAQKVYDKCTFLSQDKTMTKNNLKQAYYPKDVYILENEVGTANGCIMEVDHKMIINLPGPPKELKYVLEHALQPYLETYRDEQLYTYDYQLMGIGESRVDDILSDLESYQKDVTIAMYAGEGKVRIRLGVKAFKQEDADVLLQPYKDEIEKRLSKYILYNIYDALKEVMVPITWSGDLEIPGFLIPYNTQGDLHIDTHILHKDIGDIVQIYINDKEYLIPTLHSYSYSYTRIENYFLLRLYEYLRG